MKQETFNIVTYGDILFKPPIPDMNFIIAKEDTDLLGVTYHAICIHLDVDCYGQSISEAQDRLKMTLRRYIDDTIAYAASAPDALNAIADTAYTHTQRKGELFDAYQNAKHNNAKKMIAKGKNSLWAELKKAVSCFFQSGDVRLAAMS
jgi:hypothetical protein